MEPVLFQHVNTLVHKKEVVYGVWWGRTGLHKTFEMVMFTINASVHIGKFRAGQNDSLPVRESKGAFQTGYIALRRALRSENNHGRHIEESFQTEELKTVHSKGPFGMKGTTDGRVGLPWSFAWHLRDDAEGHFKKQLLAPLHPSTLWTLTTEGKLFEGIRA